MPALNPLEQKARSSFWKGTLITAFIAILVIGGLGVWIYQLIGKEKRRVEAQQDVVILQQNVVSGQALSSNMFKKVKVDAAGAPNGAAKDANELMSLVLADKEGNQITKMKKDDGTYYKDRWIINIKSEDNPETADIDEGEHQVFVNEQGNYFYELDKEGNRVELDIDESGNETRYIAGTNKRVSANDTVAKYIDMAETSYVAKIDLRANTVLTASMIVAINEKPTDDLREEEYNMIALPTTLVSDDTVDIRLRLANGQDFVVISKKRITVPSNGTGLSATTISMKLNEGELLTMSSAIIDAYKMSGSKLYAIKYVEPGMQNSATLTYTPSQETLELLDKDPNILNVAKAELTKYYAANGGAGANYVRGKIVEEINKVNSETRTSNVESSVSSETSTQRVDRQQYLESVAGE